jgi:hypothetical protein
LTSAPVPEPSQIERLQTLDAEVFRRRYFEVRRPVVLPGLCRDWPALERWNLGYLRGVPTERDVPVDVYERGDFFEIGGVLGHRKRKELPFGDYLAPPAPGAVTRYYAPDLELSRYFPGLAADVTVPAILPAEARPRLFLFAGHDAVTAGHFHPFTHALTCQVTGRKRVVVYPPEDSRALYPNPWFSPAFHWSRVDLLRPDLRRFPRFAEARGMECTLEPGDALFIPVHFWHWTRGFDFSVSLLVSFEARLASWRFPNPGLACLFARAAWPLEETVKDVARKALRWVRR